MIPVEITQSRNALVEWGEEIARYKDLQTLLKTAQREARLSGIKCEIAGRHPAESAADQRYAIASAVTAEVAATNNSGQMTLAVFDNHWQPATAVSRRRGRERLSERSERRYGLAGVPGQAAYLEAEAGVRWIVTLELEVTDLAPALCAVEQDQGALLFSGTEPQDGGDILRDLFADEHGVLASRPLWPLWAARRSKSGDIVILADELNDHTGRRAFVLRCALSIAPVDQSSTEVGLLSVDNSSA